MAKASDNKFPSVLFGELASAPTTPAAGNWRVYTKPDGLYVVDDAGTETGPLGSGGGVTTTKVKYVGGTYTLSSTTWANVHASNLDLTLAAVAGDVIEVGLSALGGNQNAELYLDAATIVSAAAVNYVGTAGGGTERGVQAWFLDNSINASAGGSVLYTVQAGDVSGGNVTVRLYYRASAAASKELFATSAIPLHFWMKNLG